MDLYVSTNGKDTNPGTKEAPFASLCRAREEARKHVGSVVHIEAGRYFVRDTFELDGRGTPKRRTASITSKPLFIRVAESTVIFAPIDQVGWRSVSARVTVFKSSLVLE